MARLDGLFPVAMLPWVKSGVTEATTPPYPYCRGFVPAFVPFGADPILIVLANCVANATVDCLNPVVPALATLFPRMLISVEDRDIPVKDVFNADVKPMIPPR